MKKQQIPEPVKNALQEALDRYAESEAKTKGGLVGRFLARWVPLSFVLGIIKNKVK